MGIEPDQWKQTPMGDLPLEERLQSFDEVALGYTEDEVRAEAERCLQCLYPTCIDGCPNQNPIPDFIAQVQEGRMLDAAAVDYERNSLAACTGRVCAWERQCEGACVLNARGEGVRIGAIERYIADYALRHSADFDRLRAERTAKAPGHGNRARREAVQGRRVAVVGAGPAGLACADFLSREGVAVTIFDAAPYSGGLLSDGIPEFVLPQATVAGEVDRLKRQGVAFRFSTALGSDATLDELRRAFDAIFLGIGAGRPRQLDVPGEDAAGVWTAQRFLRQAKRALADGSAANRPEVGARVLIVGAGNTAMDAARTALRLGAKEVRIVYRRTEAESSSRPIEVRHARKEGVVFEFLVNPVAFLVDDQGHVRAARLVRMALTTPTGGGRPEPAPVPRSEFEVPCDTVVLAIGYSVQGDVVNHPELVNRRGAITAGRGGDQDGHTQLGGVFAGGDAVRGPATVVEAIRDGRLAAGAILNWLVTRPEGSAPSGSD